MGLDSLNYDQLGFFSDSTLASSTNNEVDLPQHSYTNLLSISAPIFMVDGFVIFETMNTWGDIIARFKQHAAFNKTPCPPLHRLQSGGLISAHDMAVSIFYQIKGGREDFGEVHSNKHQHERLGFTYKGLYPEWSGTLPIHILGYSFGGNIILELQKLLDEQFFHNELGKTYLTDGGWILSAAMVSSPLRGTTAVYYLGSKLNKRGTVRIFSLFRLFFFLAQIWEWLLTLNSQDSCLGFHFRMSHFKIYKDRSVFNFLRNLFAFELFDKGLDTAIKDLGVEKYIVAPYHGHPSTFYRTYVTAMKATPTADIENPNSIWLPVIPLIYNFVSQFDIGNFGKGSFDYMFSNESSWLTNDGTTPLISQFHPKDCHKEDCHHLVLPIHSKSCKDYFPSNIYPGTWYTSLFPNSSHFDLIPGFDSQVEIPPVVRWVFNLWSIIQSILFLSCFSHVSSKKPTPEAKTRSLFGCIFMDDYISFLEKVNLIHDSSKLIDLHQADYVHELDHILNKP